MSWFRKPKLIFYSLRSIVHRPTIFPESPFHTAFSQFHRHGSSNPSARFSGFASISSRNAGLCLRNSLGKTNTSAINPFLSCPKRFFSGDRVHFKPRGPRRWFRNPRTVLTVVLLGSCVVGSLEFYVTKYIDPWVLETIPYTYRQHLVVMARSTEKTFGEVKFQEFKDGFKGKMLPETHPNSIRIRLIAKNIIGALQKDLNLGCECSDLGYATMAANGSVANDSEVKDMVMAPSNKDLEKSFDEGDPLSDIRMRMEDKEKWSQPMTSHLEGLNWEVIVVDEPVPLASAFPAGKIVVYSGILEHLKTDAEIATVIAHEVAHVVARHKAEGLTRIGLWVPIFQVVLFLKDESDIINMARNLFSGSREYELEADYIGLLLLASAGYDPQVAPDTYVKLGMFEEDTFLKDYLSSHPSGKKRAQLLARPKVMEEALKIYREVQSSRHIEDSL